MIENEIEIIEESNDKLNEEKANSTIKNFEVENKMNCSLRQDGIIENCDACGLKCVCDGINSFKNKLLYI